MKRHVPIQTYAVIFAGSIVISAVLSVFLAIQFSISPYNSGYFCVVFIICVLLMSGSIVLLIGCRRKKHYAMPDEKFAQGAQNPAVRLAASATRLPRGVLPVAGTPQQAATPQSIDQSLTGSPGEDAIAPIYENLPQRPVDSQPQQKQPPNQGPITAP